MIHVEDLITALLLTLESPSKKRLFIKALVYDSDSNKCCTNCPPYIFHTDGTWYRNPSIIQSGLIQLVSRSRSKRTWTQMYTRVEPRPLGCARVTALERGKERRKLTHREKDIKVLTRRGASLNQTRPIWSALPRARPACDSLLSCRCSGPALIIKALHGV